MPIATEGYSMTADQLRECREDFMEWFRTTSPQTLDFTLQSTIREFAYQAWKDATIKANTRPTAVASHAEGVVAADDPQTDREALVYLMQAFDTESWQCPRCGHDEDCATMDSAYFLRDYLRDNPPRSGDEAYYREIARLIGQIFFYGDFKAETYNERLLEALLRKTGNFHDTQQQADAAMADRGDDK